MCGLEGPLIVGGGEIKLSILVLHADLGGVLLGLRVLVAGPLLLLGPGVVHGLKNE